MTVDEARDVVKFLLAGFPQQVSFMKPEEMRYVLAFYASSLEDLEYADVKAACVRLGRVSEKIPSVAAIRAAVVTTRIGGAKTGAEAWGAVHRAMKSEGSHRVPGKDFVFPDPITSRVVSALGWGDICASTNLDHVRARFIDAYNQITISERREAQAADGARAPQLAGTGRKPLELREGRERSLGKLLAGIAPLDPPEDAEDDQ